MIKKNCKLMKSKYKEMKRNRNANKRYWKLRAYLPILNSNSFSSLVSES